MESNIGHIDPLGISKNEWKRVLGANAALIALAYGIACLFTAFGSDEFLLGYENQALGRTEKALREIGCFPIVQICFQTIEISLISFFANGKRFKWWIPLAYLGGCIAIDASLTALLGACPPWIPYAISAMAIMVPMVFPKEKGLWTRMARALIALAISFCLNLAIAYFRTGVLKMNSSSEMENQTIFALSMEYDISLAVFLGFTAMALPEKRKGGGKQCPIGQHAYGSSPISTKSRKKNPKTKNDLPRRVRRRIALRKAKVAALQTVALVFCAFIPWLFGKEEEFAFVFVSFCMTRMCLGFRKSLHFKSGMACISIGTALFIALSYLTPSIEASIVFSFFYGSVTAILFRAYWELHDLSLYRMASKNDRYAMAYCALRGNLSPNHVRGFLRLRGYGKEDISIFQEYMEGVKVAKIAEDFNYSKIWVEQKLTSMAAAAYETR